MQRITSALMNKDISSKTAQDLIKTFSQPQQILMVILVVKVFKNRKRS